MPDYNSNTMFAGIRGFTPTFGSPNLKDPSASYANAFGAYANTAADMTKTGFDQLNQSLFERQQQNAGIWQGYQNLNQRIQRKLAGSNEANLTDLRDQYDARSGQLAQQMIDRGLGNTTVQQAMQNGLERGFAKERTRSNNSFAQLQADSMQKVMMGGLGARERGADALTGIRGMGLNFLSSMTPMPPDFGSYFSAAQALGANRMPGPLPGMPGQSPTFGPTGGAQPAGLFSSSYGYEGGGGGGGAMDPSFYGRAPGNGYFGGYQPPTADTGSGMWGPLYAAAQSGGQAAASMPGFWGQMAQGLQNGDYGG